MTGIFRIARDNSFMASAVVIILVALTPGESHASGPWVASGGPGDVARIVVDPQRSGVLYAATWPLAPATSHVFKSSDAAASWADLGAAPADYAVLALAVAPSASSTIYAAAEGGGGSYVYKSVDGGTSWILTRFLPGPGIDSIAVDPSNPAILYAAGNVAQPQSPPPCGFGRICPILFSPAVLRSEDGGSTWVNNDGNPSGLVLSSYDIVEEVMTDPNEAGVVYLRTNLTLWKSTDKGTTWAKIYTQGYCPLTALAIDPRDSSRLYVSAAYNGVVNGCVGVVRSIDGGSHFSVLPLDGLPKWDGRIPITIDSIAIDPRHPGTLYLAYKLPPVDQIGNPPIPSAVAKTTDGGETWSSLDWPEPFAPTALKVDSSGGILYAAPQQGVFTYSISFRNSRRTVPFR